LGEEVADVRATGRLTDSAVVLAADDKGPDLQVQRLMRRAGRAMVPARAILEVNPRHKLIEGLVGKQDDKDLVKNVAETLLDLAKVQEGEPLKDASGFARRVSTLLAASLTV
jgi:molecular chaperone HtpG